MQPDAVADALRRFSGRVLVTGAGGYIGRALCARLAFLGSSLTGVGRSAAPPGFAGRWIRCDLTDWAAVSALVAECRAAWVFHLAGCTIGDQGIDAAWPTLRDNVLGTVPLLAAVSKTGCDRIVLTASLRDPDPALGAVPLSPYSASKAASSSYARMFHKLHGLPLVLARLFMVYGPGLQDPKRIVPYVTAQLAAGAEARISSGVAAFDFVFIDDVVDALLACAVAEDVIGQTLDVGSGVLTSIVDVATMVADLMGRRDLLHAGAIPDRRFERARDADVEGMAARTGWRAQVALREGLTRYIEWHRETQPARV